jgi:hypothetical protein
LTAANFNLPEDFPFSGGAAVNGTVLDRRIGPESIEAIETVETVETAGPYRVGDSTPASILDGTSWNCDG